MSRYLLPSTVLLAGFVIAAAIYLQPHPRFIAAPNKHGAMVIDTSLGAVYLCRPAHSEATTDWGVVCHTLLPGTIPL